MSTIFKKIFVNNQEINESELVAGKYQLPAGQTSATVGFMLKDGETIIPDVFYGNSQIKSIKIKSGLTIPNYAFYGTNIPEGAIKDAIFAINPNAFNPKNQEPVNPDPQEPEFIEKTYYFISYGDNQGETEYARGSVITVDSIISNENIIYQGINVINNSNESFNVDNPYYISKSAEPDNDVLYQLYHKNEDTLEPLEIWVKISEQEFPLPEQVNPYYFISYNNAGEETGRGNINIYDNIQTIEDREYNKVELFGQFQININNPYYINSQYTFNSEEPLQLYNVNGNTTGIQIKLYKHGLPENNTDEPENLDLFYVGTIRPTNENLETLNTEEFIEWTPNNFKSINLGLTTPTDCYIMIPKNHIYPLVFDSNNDLVQQFEKVESITNYDIYKFSLGHSIYKLYFDNTYDPWEIYKNENNEDLNNNEQINP